ncbi:MAG: 4-demethylwyosine synthase TYW1 [Candidatus Nanoarchaeia archaeon]|nr:4-demethylwyosine synthase TYW1 [Candidatus Nanoarchaeia archaeon]
MDKAVYQKKRYSMAGEHSAVKLCNWTRKSLRDEGVCYKEKFYNIKSHRCLQMTPAVAWCQHYCLFCWRPTEFTMGNSMNDVKIDEPKKIIDEAIKAQKKLLIGFKGNSKINKEMLKEAFNPNQAAISLAGEPTLYPKLGELIQEFHNRDFTTFLVTNGMNPEVIKNLKPLPTQLYITLVASNPKDYFRLTKSCFKEKGFDNLLETIKATKDLNTRKVLRLTLVKGYNMNSPKEYANIIKQGNVHFVEAKSYMHVGSSVERLNKENMPTFEEIQKFSEELAKELGWKIIDEHEPSRVCLIAKEDYTWRKFNK